MITSIPRLAAALVQQPVVLPDTIITRQVTDGPGWATIVTGIAHGILLLLLIVLLAVLIPAAWNFRKSAKRVTDLIDRAYGDIEPVVRRAHAIADNIEAVTTSVREEVRQVNQVIGSANRRLLRAVDAAERRVQELHALVDVVQEEAEEAFVSTASTVRGVRAGMTALRSELADDEAMLDTDLGPLADDDEPADAPPAAWREMSSRSGELSDGDYDGTTGTDAGERPRVRPRGSDRT